MLTVAKIDKKSFLKINLLLIKMLNYQNDLGEVLLFNFNLVDYFILITTNN